MFYHILYGLHIESNQHIPGLSLRKKLPIIDVELSLGTKSFHKQELIQPHFPILYESPSTNDITLSISRHPEQDRYYFTYGDGTEIILDLCDTELTKIWGIWPENQTIEDFSAYLLGPIFGTLLRLRGVVCLHGSAVALDNKALVLVGPSGAGKSTTAAAFAQRGYPILTEDNVTLQPRFGAFFVEPGYSLIRLWPESVRILYGDFDALPRLSPTSDKRYLDLSGSGEHGIAEHSLPIAAIYFLGKRFNSAEAPLVSASEPNKALLWLITNTYGSRFLTKAQRAHELEVLADVVSNIPIRQVIPHTDPRFLWRLIDVILDDFRIFSTH